MFVEIYLDQHDLRKLIDGLFVDDKKRKEITHVDLCQDYLDIDFHHHLTSEVLILKKFKSTFRDKEIFCFFLYSFDHARNINHVNQ